MPTDTSPEAVAKKWASAHWSELGPIDVSEIAALIRAERRRCARALETLRNDDGIRHEADCICKWCLVLPSAKQIILALNHPRKRILKP